MKRIKIVLGLLLIVLFAIACEQTADKKKDDKETSTNPRIVLIV